MAGRRSRVSPNITRVEPEQKVIKPPYDSVELQAAAEALVENGTIGRTTLSPMARAPELFRVDTPLAEHIDRYGVHQRLLGIIGVEHGKIVARPDERGDVISYIAGAALVHAEVPTDRYGGRRSILTLTKTGSIEMDPDNDFDLRSRWRSGYVISEGGAQGKWSNVISPNGAELHLSYDPPAPEDAWWSTPYLSAGVTGGTAQMIHAHAGKPTPALEGVLGHLWAGQSDMLLQYASRPPQA